MTEIANFKAYSQYYDALYRDKDYAIEAERVKELIVKFYPAAKTVLELGCGTGNHAGFFSQMGLATTGLERSEEMIALAKAKKILNFEPTLADIKSFDLKRKFDIAVSLFHVISYLNKNEELISCFQCVNAHLEPGGLFIFDAWYSPAIYHDKPEKRVKQLSTSHMDITRHAEPSLLINQNVVDVAYEILVRDKATDQSEIIREQHSMRHFSIPEIALLATFTGFELLNVRELLSGATPSSDSWAICFVLKKLCDIHTS
jgi:SAM-dependent methyltransferase